MKTTAGIWIDHRKAVIAMISNESEKTLEIKSNVEKHPGRFEGIRSTASHKAQHVQSDDGREREFTGDLNQYYEQVIEVIRNTDSILIFGPGEAKGELKKRLEHAKLGNQIVAMETNDKMTDHQIAAKVRDYFNNRAPTERILAHELH